MQSGESKRKNISEGDVDPKQLSIGKKIEMEHVSKSVNKSDVEPIAKKISLDHLSEDKKYYTHLVKMENEAKKNMKKESCVTPIKLTTIKVAADGDVKTKKKDGEIEVEIEVGKKKIELEIEDKKTKAEEKAEKVKEKKEESSAVKVAAIPQSLLREKAKNYKKPGDKGFTDYFSKKLMMNMSKKATETNSEIALKGIGAGNIGAAGGGVIGGGAGYAAGKILARGAARTKAPLIRRAATMGGGIAGAGIGALAAGGMYAYNKFKNKQSRRRYA